jgi:6-phosphogluconolactonase
MLRKLTTFFLILLFSFACMAQQCYVFVGSYNKDKTKEGIYVFEMDTISGALTKVSAVDSVLNPAYLTLSPNGKFVYACTDAKTPGAGSVSSFAFNHQLKTLTFVNSQKSSGENPIYITTDNAGKWLLNGSYNEGSLSAYRLTNAGEINSSAQVLTFTGTSLNKERQERSHIHSTVFSRNGKYLFAPDLGADKIWCFAFDSTKQTPLQPTIQKFIKTIPGSGPRHLVFDAAGKYAYCTEELSGTVSAYKYNKGKLKRIQRVNAHADTVTTQFSSSDIHLSPDGKFLYASNRGEENNIAIYSIQKNGKLKLAGYQPTLGKTPRIFAISANGKFVIAANQSTGNIVVFKRNATTGLLTYTGFEVKAEGATCVKIQQY